MPQKIGCCCKKSNSDIITADTSGIYTAYCAALADDKEEIVQTLEPLLWPHLITWARLKQSVKPLNNWLSSLCRDISHDVKFFAIFNTL